jgi:hypothetical protein
MLDRLSTLEIKKKIKKLDSVYHITEDREVRRQMLLVLDELKLELINRGINWKN